LRSYSPVRAIGGGKILNALPVKKKRFSDAVMRELKLLNSGSLQEKAEEFIRMSQFQGITAGELQFLTNSSKKRLEEALKVLMSQKKIILYNQETDTFIHREYLEKAREEIISRLDEFHRDYPLKAGLVKEELRSRTAGSRNQRLFNFIIARIVKEGGIVQEKELVRLKGHRVTLAGDQEKIRHQIEEVYLKGGLQPPYFKDLREKFPDKAGADVLEVMVKDGLLVKVKEDLYFHRDAMEDLKKRLVDFLKEKGEISTPQFKEMTGVSRKYTIPIIEYFDRSRITVRVGDSRVLRKQG